MTDASGTEQLIKVKNQSAGGVMAIVTRMPEVGEQVSIELSSQRIPSSVVWTRDDTIGLKFDQNVVSSGPYRLLSYSSEKIAVVRDDAYWGNLALHGGKKPLPSSKREWIA